MTDSYKRGSYDIISDHFNSSEFDCKCNSSNCTVTLVDPSLIEKLESMRKNLGGPLVINSGFRCPSYQTELRLRGYETSTGISQHELGRAADVMGNSQTGEELEKLARGSGFMAVGVGHSWIHVDLRNDKTRRWVYTKR